MVHNPKWAWLDMNEHSSHYTEDITLGCDPEFSLTHAKSGEFVSAHDLVPGTKAKPHWFEHGLGSVQADGTAVEIGIRPVSTPEEFAIAVIATMKSVRAIIDDSLVFNFAPKRTLNKDYWRSLPTIATEIGCSPDKDMSNSKINPTPELKEGRVYFGGHIHYGFRNPDDKNPLSHDIKDKEDRQLLYNLNCKFSSLNSRTNGARAHEYPAGYRDKPYGFEYRRPSSVWLAHPEELEGFAQANFDVILDTINNADGRHGPMYTPNYLVGIGYADNPDTWSDYK